MLDLLLRTSEATLTCPTSLEVSVLLEDMRGGSPHNSTSVIMSPLCNNEFLVCVSQSVLVRICLTELFMRLQPDNPGCGKMLLTFSIQCTDLSLFLPPFSPLSVFSD